MEFKPPRVAGICDVCGHELDQPRGRRRGDGHAGGSRSTSARPSRSSLFFWERGLLREIDAEAPEEVVADRTIEAIADLLDTYE